MPVPGFDQPIVIHEATGHFLSPDTTTTTRTDFTKFFLNFRSAPDAHPLYKHLFDAHQNLIRLLVDHPAMRPNLTQTFSTPANSKNKVYFMWDFVLRSFQFLAARVDPRDPIRSEMFQDVVGRGAMAESLIQDETGKLEAMNAIVGYSHDEGVEFTDEIKTAAAKLMDITEPE